MSRRAGSMRRLPAPAAAFRALLKIVRRETGAARAKIPADAAAPEARLSVSPRVPASAFFVRRQAEGLQTASPRENGVAPALIVISRLNQIQPSVYFPSGLSPVATPRAVVKYTAKLPSQCPPS